MRQVPTGRIESPPAEEPAIAARSCFVELRADETAPAKRIYAAAFDLATADFGPCHARAVSGAVDLGPQANRTEATGVAVRGAGGRITRPTFSFPGGRRFHFMDLSGNGLAAMQSI